MKNMIRTLLKNKKPLLWGITLLAVAVLLLGGNLISLVHNKLEMRRLQQQNIRLDREYQTLLQTKQALQEEDPALLEKLARTQYNLAKPNEIEFRFQNK